MTRILCTGRPGHGGIARCLDERYSDIHFVSKSLNLDLNRESDYEEFLDTVKHYDVFINHAQIAYGMQERLIRDVAEVWTEGHIITIGSVLEFDEFAWVDPVTHREKLDIRNTSLHYASEKIKTTHLITSGFQRHGPEEDVKIDPQKIVDTIDWILQVDVDIPLIFVDTINDARYQRWRSLRPQADDT
mgnify:CR=1 FL=1